MVLEKLDVLFQPGATRLRVPAGDLNMAWSPELISTGFEIASDSLMTKLGSALLNLAIAGTEIGVSLIPGIGDFDKAFLHNMAAHSSTRVLSLLATPDFGVALNQARGLGAAMKARNYGGAKSLLLRNDLDGVLGEFQRGFEKFGESAVNAGKQIFAGAKEFGEKAAVALEGEVVGEEEKDETYEGNPDFWEPVAQRTHIGGPSADIPVVGETIRKIARIDSHVAAVTL